MEITELTIGDIVQYLDGKKLITVVVVKVDGSGNVVRLKQKNGHKFNTTIDFLKPIPLTPEILEKNGWIRTKYDYGRDCMEIYGADELPEGVDNVLSMARWSIDKNYQYHFLDLYMWKGSVMQHNVHYIHQLQHAFRIFKINIQISLP